MFLFLLSGLQEMSRFTQYTLAVLVGCLNPIPKSSALELSLKFLPEKCA